MKTDNKTKKSEFVNVSADFIKSVKDFDSEVYDAGEDQVWKNIELEIRQRKNQKTRRILIYSLSTAASILVLLGGSFYFLNQKSNSTPKTALIVTHPEIDNPSNEIILLTGQNQKLSIEDQASLTYDADGNAQVNSVALDNLAKSEESLNQIIVPKGKRMNLYFSDGTKMFINSNTRVTFPAVFNDKKRSIFVDGEVYLEVKKDNNRPFIVETNSLTVQVRGTSFNVNSYSKNQESAVVLVEGKVDVETKSGENMSLSPNEMFQLKGQDVEKKKVDVFEYICWTQNVMMFDKEPLDKALNRLSEYYGKEIIADIPLNNIPLNGKIDLRDSFEEVLAIIEATVPVTFTVRNESIYVNKK